ncbi:MAG TPA: hypothetical protein DER60_11250 [Syntrophomonas sp.]|jgi:hypothetical protein|nr:hypothetical protein [Syntrophomonas sp.]
MTMHADKEKIANAIKILNKMANGLNPVSGEKLDENCFLHDPRMIRCLFFVQNVLNQVVKGEAAGRGKMEFSITAEEKDRIEFPDGLIGVNAFARCVNNVIDLSRSRKITGMEINKQLKQMGILSEELLEDGKKRTKINENSHQYGIETMRKNYNGVEYDMVCFNDAGKQFLLDHLEEIAAAKAKET